MNTQARRHIPVSGGRILVADDDAHVRRLARAMLERDGHIVQEATDGDQAYQAFAERRPDLVLMDIGMPVMDGLEACRQIRSHPDGHDTPVLLITGGGDLDEIDRAYGVGATDFQQKPINWTVLAHRVRYMLRASRTTEDLRSSEAEKRALLNAIPDLIVQINRNGIFVDVKPGNGQRSTIRSTELLGRHLTDVLPPDVAGLCEHFITRALKTSRIQVFEFQLNDETESLDFEARVVASGPDQVLGIVRDITERRRSEAELEFHAYHDPLTKLPTRLLFRERLVHALSRARERKDLLAVIFLGLDRFKQVNDTFGHRLGDLVLKHVASQLAATLQAENLVLGSRNRDDRTMLARFGSDEFTILVPALLSLDVLDSVVDRMVNAIAQPYDLAGHEVSLTASVGVSVFPNDGQDADTLLKNADTALRNAKSSGRNSRHAYRPDMNASASENLSLESQLRRALREHQFRAFFQPKVDVKTNRITGAEALIRWQHPTRGLLLPRDFLALAEEMGLSVPIGDQLMQMVCEHSAAWRDATGRTVPIAINLSNVEFRQDQLVNRIQTATSRLQLNPSNVEVEITERVLIHDREAARSLLAELHELGVRVAIDDFGTGYSSLSILKGLSLDTLKIDRSFIKDLASEPESSAITATIIHMGHDLGMTVIAEGVETPDQLAMLRSMDCDQFQGFLFSRAVSGEAFVELLVADASPEPDASAPSPAEPVTLPADAG